MTIELTNAGEKGLGKAGESHEGQHARFMEDIQSAGGNDRFNPRPEYKNGLASQDFIEIEKWVDDSKKCGAVDQDKLASRLTDFGQKTDSMWQKMENDPKDFVRMSQDQWLTYPRFNKVFDLLDDKHRDKALETLPWSLRAGE